MTGDRKEVHSALQDIIYRLQDAEEGFVEVEKAVSNLSLKKWLKRYAKERHLMHRELETLCSEIGEKAEVATTFLGTMHRMFIDIKINNTSGDSEFDAVVDEIQRGSTTLLADYDKVLSEVSMPINYFSILSQQRAQIESELNSLLTLREELNSVEV